MIVRNEWVEQRSCEMEQEEEEKEEEKIAGDAELLSQAESNDLFEKMDNTREFCALRVLIKDEEEN